MPQSPMQPDLMSANERIEEAADLLARGFLRYWIRRVDERQKGLDVLAASSHSCVEPTARPTSKAAVRGETQ